MVRVRGLPGRLYVPDAQVSTRKKHPCRDCDMCQWCSDVRCDECLKRATCSAKERLTVRRRKRRAG